MQGPLLISRLEGETLFMYLFVTKNVVSSILYSLRNDKMMHVYYVINVLVGVETQYILLEKHIYNTFVQARKLKPTFKHTPSQFSPMCLLGK